MFSTIWNIIKTPFVWMKNTWVKFNTWLAQFMPGWKTQIINTIGIVGAGAATLQEYVTQLPLDKFVTANQIAITGIVLMTLAFWARHLTNYNND